MCEDEREEDKANQTHARSLTQRFPHSSLFRSLTLVSNNKVNPVVGVGGRAKWKWRTARTTTTGGTNHVKPTLRTHLSHRLRSFGSFLLPVQEVFSLYNPYIWLIEWNDRKRICYTLFSVLFSLYYFLDCLFHFVVIIM